MVDTLAPSSSIGGRGEPDRFTYWPRSIARGGRVLAPGAPEDPVQYIDVRDLAEFIVSGVEHSGVCNVAGPVMGWTTCCGHAGRPTLGWVPTRWLLDAGVDPWMGVPMWVAAPGWAAANRVDVTRALDAGLAVRPLADTVRDATTTAEPMFIADEERRLLDAYLR